MKIAICNADYITREIDIDQNNALEKAAAYHLNLGDEVVKYNPVEHWNVEFDKVYLSSIFTFTNLSVFPIKANWICGGTGIDVHSRLPEEIERIKHYKGFGFFSRGCPFNCKWCVVREKEGELRPEADLYDLWDGKNRYIKAFDNNVLALPEHFKLIAGQAIKERVKIDFNQGLDIKLIDEESAALLKKFKWGSLKFAFDNIKFESIIREKIKMLESIGITNSTWYVLLGCETELEEDIYRLETLRDLGQSVAPMPYRKIFEGQPESKVIHSTKPLYDALETWGYKHSWFKGMNLKTYLNSKYGLRYKPYFRELGLAG
jgi:hypothetical protein